MPFVLFESLSIKNLVALVTVEMFWVESIAQGNYAFPANRLFTFATYRATTLVIVDFAERCAVELEVRSTDERSITVLKME